ncbi:NADPH-dependent FMN reductase [Demequina sp. SYSU T00192]|uniref:NADPH-dependent FMN reductase n=1 Tax=Demequina litoralis TaxID=3051660 RepID=A0ABT8GCP7_9MICO|nr:NADPH-dependent FMN reductase [Demequina sp. SYSU T00192]MDN4476910.1 NADPH-dependent FMN reductase [Demequina sp. SYSU T00192]
MPVIGLLLGHLPQARTTRLLSSLLHAAAPAGTRLVELTPNDLPLHAPYSDAPLPHAGLEWKRQIDAVDGLLVITPTHERSIPGVLKHALDWASCSPSSLEDKPVVIAGAAAPRVGSFMAIVHLRSVLADAGALVMGQPERTLTVQSSDFSAHGRCHSAELDAQAHALLGAAAGYVAHVMRAGGSGPLPTVPSDPVRAVRAERAAAPVSPAGGIPAFVDTVATTDPLVQTGDPLYATLRTDSTTGAPAA